MIIGLFVSKFIIKIPRDSFPRGFPDFNNYIYICALYL